MLPLSTEAARLEAFVSSPAATQKIFTLTLALHADGARHLLSPLFIHYPRPTKFEATKPDPMQWLGRVDKLDLVLPLTVPAGATEPSAHGWARAYQHYRQQANNLFAKMPWQADSELTLTGLFTITATHQCKVWQASRRITPHIT